MARRNPERQRIAALEARLRQLHGLPSLDRLNAVQRAEWDAYSASYKKWAAQFPTKAALFEAILDGIWVPTPPAAIARLIWGEPPMISANMTVDQLRELYQRMATP
ncbi:hypothetical protein EJ070_31705 [Mesorhizobium sp. M1E.F.Ca.ET.045.02.1.1]|uniref:hypothetical protein n=1 Tax=Mesorhizobium sp. M1E.F.Ca.ET.045.02.1.1 TaxID=2493672 RepID=UPI000F75296C|nr:hypothetical protein [Mesorhizobium sp. M1E.F.Ca.ET.045.02.1.1]AZO24784.1 hypothetical protein EJ070_31705 [Mesorhizobium sp. M1E.F.Ca.ET.045.02.1.1]